MFSAAGKPTIAVVDVAAYNLSISQNSIVTRQSCEISHLSLSLVARTAYYHRYYMKLWLMTITLIQ
jgi:hypothetical protein